MPYHEDDPIGRSFDWDPVKNVSNLEKHRLTLTDAAAVFDDPNHVILDITRPEHGEKRFKAIGQIDAKVWTIVFTPREGMTRLISARRARDDERRIYSESAKTS